MSWTEQPLHFIDFEGSRQSGVLEYGVATVRAGRVCATVGRLCAPVGEVRREDSTVHGLYAEDLGGNKPFSEDWEVFAAFRETGPLAAHFAGVEHSLLCATWPYPRRSPDFARGGTALEWGPWVDTAQLYGQLYPSLGSRGLESIVAACGLQGELDSLASEHCPPGRRRYHAALYDALAGALLLCSLARDEKLKGLSLMQLLALSTLDAGKRDRMVQRELF